MDRLVATYQALALVVRIERLTTNQQYRLALSTHWPTNCLNAAAITPIQPFAGFTHLHSHKNTKPITVIKPPIAANMSSGFPNQKTRQREQQSWRRQDRSPNARQDQHCFVHQENLYAQLVVRRRLRQGLSSAAVWYDG
jgi:hypothetical protein